MSYPSCVGSLGLTISLLHCSTIPSVPPGGILSKDGDDDGSDDDFEADLAEIYVLFDIARRSSSPDVGLSGTGNREAGRIIQQ